MKPKQIREKKRGTSGRYVVTVDASSSRGEFQPDQLGFSKEDIESSILSVFCEQIRAMGGRIEPSPDRRENGLDFEVQTPGGAVDIELTEFVPDAPERCDPFQLEATLQTQGSAADRLVAAIRKKDRYPGGTRPVHLLIYPTDYKVRVPRDVLVLARIELAEAPPSTLEEVYWVQPGGIESEQLMQLFPADVSRYPPHLREKARSVQFIQLDPSKAELRRG